MIDSPQAPPRGEGIHLKRYGWEEHRVIHTSKMIKSSVFNLTHLIIILTTEIEAIHIKSKKR